MKPASLALRFLLEIGALVAFGYWGFQIGGGLPVQVVLGIGTPVIAALVWGAFVAPKAWRRAPDPLRLGIEILFFGLAALALAGAGQPILAVLFAVIAAADTTLLTIWRLR